MTTNTHALLPEVPDMPVDTTVYPDDGGDMDELFRHADAGMYAAKRRRTELHEPGASDR